MNLHQTITDPTLTSYLNLPTPLGRYDKEQLQCIYLTSIPFWFWGYRVRERSWFWVKLRKLTNFKDFQLAGKRMDEKSERVGSLNKKFLI